MDTLANLQNDINMQIKKTLYIFLFNYLPISKYPGAGKEVFVCGTFSEWKPIPMVKSQKDFVALIDLPVGEHQVSIPLLI